MVDSHSTLSRFHEAQAGTHATAASELSAGTKMSHWMWFIFPQLAGLGQSEMSRRYAIADLDEARLYLDDPILGERLRENVRLVLGHRTKTAHGIFGSPDEQKFLSCLTLFEQAAAEKTEKGLFSEAIEVFYGGGRDERTLVLLNKVGKARR